MCCLLFVVLTYLHGWTECGGAKIEEARLLDHQIAHRDLAGHCLRIGQQRVAKTGPEWWGTTQTCRCILHEILGFFLLNQLKLTDQQLPSPDTMHAHCVWCRRVCIWSSRIRAPRTECCPSPLANRRLVGIFANSQNVLDPSSNRVDCTPIAHTAKCKKR